MHERYFDAMDGRMMACRIHLEGLKEPQFTKATKQKEGSTSSLFGQVS